MQISKSAWRRLAKTVELVGFAAFFCLFLSGLVLAFYYTGHRPHAPRPDLGWTVPLQWTHPTSYGSARDAALQFWLFWWGLPSFGVIAVGFAIRIYVLGEDVRRRPTRRS